MAWWIESHQELGRHPKTKRLARLLGITKPTAVGHLHYLWWWALDFAQDGDITRYDPDDICEGALWEDEPRIFMDALKETGFIDTTDDGRLMLHDWDEYAGKIVRRRESDAARKRRERTSSGRPESVRRTSAGHPQDIPSTSDATEPNPTEPNPTQQKRDVPTERGASAPPADASEPETPGKPSKNGRKVVWPERKPSDTTDRAYYERVLKEASESDAIPMLVNLAHAKIGADNTPGCASYGRIGALVKRHGAALVGVWILEATTAHIAGDPLDYLTTIASNKAKRAKQNGHVKPADAAPVYTTAAESAAKVWGKSSTTRTTSTTRSAS